MLSILTNMPSAIWVASASFFNGRFKMAAMRERIANAVCVCKPCPERDLRVAELYE